MLKAKSHPKPRHGLVIASSVVITLLWFIGVFYYQINDFTHFTKDWWMSGFSPAFFIDSTVKGLAEQWLSMLGLGLFALTPLFRRTISDRAIRGDFNRLLAVFALLQLLNLILRYWLLSLPEDVWLRSYGIFLVVIAGLLGRRRLAMAVALFNLFTYGTLILYHEATVHDTFLSPLNFFLTNASVVSPLWVAWLSGYVAAHWPKKRFNWVVVGLLGLAGEVMVTVIGMMSTWSMAMFLDNFWYNMAATPILLFGFTFLVSYRQNNSEEKLELTQTELALAEAELRALRAQMNPHFMVNSLSVIHHLVRTQPETARNLILDLSDLFQHTLRAGDFVPLSQELEHVRAYLALEQARLTKRLNVMWTILAENKLSTPVPTLILQPIVENAIVHGIAPKPEGGTVSILVKQTGDELHIQVIDNGVGFDPDRAPTGSERPSIGFKNIDLRLRLLYGNAYRVQVASTPGAGTTVELRIPLSSEATTELPTPTKELTHA
jgi:signal transduction histidine kinase